MYSSALRPRGWWLSVGGALFMMLLGLVIFFQREGETSLQPNRFFDEQDARIRALVLPPDVRILSTSAVQASSWSRSVTHEFQAESTWEDFVRSLRVGMSGQLTIVSETGTVLECVERLPGDFINVRLECLAPHPVRVRMTVTVSAN